MDDENDVRHQMQLNKLEAHLLKLCIPFIRVAHCPRGRYFKVKGDISTNAEKIRFLKKKLLSQEQSFEFLKAVYF